MSLPDYLLDEPPDDKYCERHELAYSSYCGHCLADEADRLRDERKEQDDAP